MVHSLRWMFLAALGTFLLLMLSSEKAPPAQATSPRSPNILFIAVDDLSTVIGAYGGQAHTPHMDQLAAKGTTFDHGYVTAVSCNPSRISMLTGLRPASTGITSLAEVHTRWREFLSNPNSPGYQNYGPGISQIKTLFEHFKDHGYFVANAGKVFHNNEQLNEEWWDVRYYWDFWPGIGWPRNMPLNGMNEYFQATGADWGVIEKAEKPEGGYFSEADLPDHRITADALQIIDVLPEDRPFFLGIGYLLPHLPWYVPQRMIEQYPSESIQLPEVLADDLMDLPPQALWLVWQDGEYYDQRYVFSNERKWKEVIAYYLAGISYVDEQIGILLDALDQRGLLENTIIVLWGDHGYQLGQKQHLQKHTLWEEVDRMPLIILAPGIGQPGQHIEPVISSVDIYPTLVDLAGLPMPEDFPRDGRSMVPLMKDPDTFWPWPAITSLGRWAQSKVDRATIRTPGWRYINYDLDGSSNLPHEELYFHPTDPHEWWNLLSPHNGDPNSYHGVSSFLESMLRAQNGPDQPPTTHDVDVLAFAGRPLSLRLMGDDPNLDYVTFTIESLPAHGRLSTSLTGATELEPITHPGVQLPMHQGWSAWVIYHPDSDSRVDGFEFSVSDGRRKAFGSVHITIDTGPIYELKLPNILHSTNPSN